MKQKIYILFILLLAIATISSIEGITNSGGRNGNWANAPGDSGFCGVCHTSAGSGSITLTGVPTSIVPNQTYNMTLTINDPGAVVGGFQIVATNGSNNALVGSFNTDGETKLNSTSRLVQNAAKAFVGGSVSWNVSWTAPATVGSNQVQFYYAGNAANGNGGNGSGDNGYAGNTANIPLPVELSAFSASQSDEFIVLKWQTSTEVNNKGFEIQHSVNGKKWEAVGFVEGKGNSFENNNYEYIDDRELIGKQYYRLKQIDNNGQFEYSKTINLVIEYLNKEVVIFPNPVDNQFTIINGKGTVTIYNMMGQPIKSLIINDVRDIIPVGDLAKGQYILEVIEEDGNRKTKRFVK